MQPQVDSFNLEQIRIESLLYFQNYAGNQVGFTDTASISNSPKFQGPSVMNLASSSSEELTVRVREEGEGHLFSFTPGSIHFLKVKAN